MAYFDAASETAIGVIFPALAIASLVVRAYSWKRYSPGIEIDDILVIPAFLLTTATGVAMVVGAQKHIIGGHSLPEITAAEQHSLGKFEWAYWMVGIVTIGFVKLTILFFFRRIFKGRSSRTAFDYANWTLIILVILWVFAFLFAIAFWCGRYPTRAWASLWSLRHECVDTFALLAACAIFSWVMDLAILIEPLLVIQTLNMSHRRKLQASLVFLCSILAVVAGLLRMITLIQIKIQGTTHANTRVLATLFPTADQEGIVSLILFWTYIEIGVGFAIACLIPCARLLDTIFLEPILSTLRLLSSAVSLSKWTRGSRSTKERELARSQTSWSLNDGRNQYKSSSQGIEDEVELVTVMNRV
ncbi:hypothetical protein VP1G_00609 [Cytospora mali]|uniref:Rhodopsin domain-containing protein n=1 Tax=Cytospora mali TaxID=578113 RepID=A0A194UNM4_CYTMA|nr:hypothetical protein VP1G_00609 [Valsa mali var. pyri (nom. inval.)]